MPDAIHGIARKNDTLKLGCMECLNCDKEMSNSRIVETRTINRALSESRCLSYLSDYLTRDKRHNDY
jgi:hypothetical protein